MYRALLMSTAAIFVATLWPALADADLIAYEGFDYVEIGDDLLGQQSSFGFSGPWRSFTGAPLTRPIKIAEGSLNFLGLQTQGNHALNPEPLATWTGLVRRLEATNTRDEQITRYMSFLMRPEGDVGRGFDMGSGLAAIEGSFAGSLLLVGKPGATNNDSYVVESGCASGWCLSSSGVPVISGDTTFLVLKAELNQGPDKFTMYVNPIPGLPEPSNGTVYDYIDIGSMSGLGFVGGGAFSFDEFRWGDTFADVAPAEPPIQLPFIEGGATWRYLPGTTEPSSFPNLGWTTSQFDDSTWNLGKEGLGYGADIESRRIATLLDDMQGSYRTVYLRKPFSVENPHDLEHLVLSIDSDDAFVAYINGVEVARSGGLQQDGEPEPVNARATARSGSGAQNYIVNLASFPNLLTEDPENVLAIQGINRSNNDNDFILSQIHLTGLISATATEVFGDFNLDGELNVLDIDDLSRQVRLGLHPSPFDVTLDGLVNSNDRDVWVHQLKRTYFGDANLDSEFNSSDLITALAAGTYEADVDAGWGSGDFDGSGRFDTGDLIFALADGGYEAGPRPGAVPEPSTLLLIALSLGPWVMCRKSVKWPL